MEDVEPEKTPQEEEKSNHEIAVESQPHDDHGHFAPKPELHAPQASKPQQASNSPLTNLLHNTTSVSKTHDDSTLLDVHIGNPLRRITMLLQDIKKQKAFSFTLKGSLGIMGVALALSVFGIFGGSKMLCDKGVQTQVGMIKELDSVTIERSTVPLLGAVFDYYSNLFTVQSAVSQKKRIILLKDDRTTIFLPNTRGVSYYNYLNAQVYATGQYDSCSQVLKPSDQSDIQPFQ